MPAPLKKKQKQATLFFVSGIGVFSGAETFHWVFWGVGCLFHKKEHGLI